MAIDLSQKKKIEAEDGHKPLSIISLPWNIWHTIVNNVIAWKTYMQHPVRNAGLGLAFLYLTVLSFDNITYGYCLNQCVSESLLGGLVSASAAFGVIASIVFPFLRRHFGLHTTGLIGMVCLVGSLSLCVVSIWLDGSPFDVEYFAGDSSRESQLGSTRNGTDSVDSDTTCRVSSHISVTVFLAGVIASRFGLCTADLSINQILQGRDIYAKYFKSNGFVAI